MLNKVILMGRITAPLELKTTPTGTNVLSFSLAVERDFKDANGERQTDFINVVAWRQTAVFISQFFDKGRMIAIEGSIQTRSYDTPNGEKRYVTEVIAEKAHFTGEARNDNATPNTTQPTAAFTPVDQPQDDDLPF